MDFPDYFADAETSFQDAAFVIYGVPYDRTVCFRRGARNAPKTIREATWNFETFNLQTGVDFQRIPVHDYGDLPVQNGDPPAEMIRQVKTFSENIVKNDKIPVVIGGEHSITTGVIQAFPQDIAVLSLDAHLDFRGIYENEVYSHACVIRRIIEHINPENVVILGIRSAEKEELIQAKKQNIQYYDAFTLHKQGVQQTVEEIKRYFTGKSIYLTVDIDVVDPAFAPGVGTPEPFGLTPFDIITCIDQFASQIIGFDVVEVCPAYDHGETSILAAKFIRHLIERIWQEKGLV